MAADVIAIACNDVEVRHNDDAEYPFEITIYGPDQGRVNENVSLEDARRLRDWLSEMVGELEARAMGAAHR